MVSGTDLWRRGRAPIDTDGAAMPLCQVCQIRITYLGVPLSTIVIPRSHVRPLIDKVAVRLSALQGPSCRA